MARNRHTWSREQAREMAVRGNIAKASRPRIQPALAAALSESPQWPDVLHGCVRQECEGLIELMSRERLKQDPDPQRLSWLATALDRLAELERRLAGRPLPKSVAPDKPARAPRPAVAPIGPAPAPELSDYPE